MDGQNWSKAEEYVSEQWDSSVIPLMSAYIEIPNVSPVFDSEWATNGLIEKAAHLLADWAKARKIPGLETEFLQLPNLTPLLFLTIPSNSPQESGTILMYGHLDKQPPLTGWADGLDPYKPVLRDGKLYGRGGADDGYAICASLLSIEALQLAGGHHGRIVILIEASEESGSPHLPTYVDHLTPKIGTPDLIVCLDSGCGNYEQFWLTTTLRGLVAGNLVVSVLEEESHSGKASGIVPSSFRIIRMLLDRLEDLHTGQIKPKELYVEIPEARLKQLKDSAPLLGKSIFEEFKWAEGCQPVNQDLVELLLNRSWRPTLCVTGAAGLPTLEKAGNVLRSSTSIKLSIRLPPTLDAKTASDFIKNLLEKDPPYGAQVRYEGEKAGSGWESPALAPWLETAVQDGCQKFYKKPCGFISEGGSIPFMGMLGKKFPLAQFVVCGLLGPSSNAHGPNEMLHIQMGKNLTSTVAYITQCHFNQFKK